MNCARAQCRERDNALRRGAYVQARPGGARKIELECTAHDSISETMNTAPKMRNNPSPAIIKSRV